MPPASGDSGPPPPIPPEPCVTAGHGLAQAGSSQSVRPSPSLSTLSEHLSPVSHSSGSVPPEPPSDSGAEAVPPPASLPPQLDAPPSPLASPVPLSGWGSPNGTSST